MTAYIETDSANAYIGRGITNFSLANYSAAKADFDKALVITPDVTYAYYFRGFSRYFLQDTGGAISDLQIASTLFTKAGKQELSEKAIAAVNKIQASHNNVRLQTIPLLYLIHDLNINQNLCFVKFSKEFENLLV